MEKKEIGIKTTVKAIITGFVSYGIISIFGCFLILGFMRQALSSLAGENVRALHITLPLIAAIFIYFIVHAVCRISTYDVFKKCKTNPENYETINKYLNIFFIFCIVLSIALFLTMLNNNIKYQLADLQLSRARLSANLPEEVVDYLTKERKEAFNTFKTDIITSTTILITSVALSFLSLISFQKEMITKYNKYENNKTEV